MQRLIGRFNGIASKFPYFQPIGNVYESAEAASEVISLNAQFGEGGCCPARWRCSPGHGVRNVVSLQPFGLHRQSHRLEGRGETHTRAYRR